METRIRVRGRHYLSILAGTGDKSKVLAKAIASPHRSGRETRGQVGGCVIFSRKVWVNMS
jgi:hypothetical protein